MAPLSCLRSLSSVLPWPLGIFAGHGSCAWQKYPARIKEVDLICGRTSCGRVPSRITNRQGEKRPPPSLAHRFCPVQSQVDWFLEPRWRIPMNASQCVRWRLPCRGCRGLTRDPFKRGPWSGGGLMYCVREMLRGVSGKRGANHGWCPWAQMKLTMTAGPSRSRRVLKVSQVLVPAQLLEFAVG